MKYNLQTIKNHVKEHRAVYITGGVCLALGVAGGFAFAKQITPMQITNTVSPVFNNNNSSNVISFGGYAHKIVKSNDGEGIWETVKEAAKAAGVDSSRMSRHLNGHIPDINGKTYSIIGMGTSAA